MIKNERGVTLIILVITMIVMVIIAGVTIKLSVGEQGIVKQAENAVNGTKEFENSSEIKRQELYNEIISPNN